MDELMGRARNVLPEERNSKIQWDSQEVCRHFLVKFCPHQLFTNTKSDLGPCEKVHDEDLKREFEAANSYRRTAFEDEFVRYAESMLTEVDKRIKKGKQRLSLSVKDALASSTTGDGRVDEQLELLSERITGLVSEAERLGSEGNIEEAQGLLKLCDQLREERDSLRRSNENSVWHQGIWVFFQAAEMAASQEKQMEVCEVCGAFLIVGDAQQRIDDHLTGKQHVGFAKLRLAIQEIRDNREKARSEREALREKDREDRHRAVVEEEKRREREKEDKRREEERRRRNDERDRERRDHGSRSQDRERRDRRDRSERRRSRSRSRITHSSDRDNRSSRSHDSSRSSHSLDRDRRDRDRTRRPMR